MIIPKRQTVFELDKLLKNNGNCKCRFVWIVKKAWFENILYEPQSILKKQEVRPENLTSAYLGWTRRAESELIFNQIISFNAIFNLSIIIYEYLNNLRINM